MGRSNSFSLNNSLLNIPYRNVFGIAFNESLSIVIRYSADGSQNMAIYIIPTENCGQHSYYTMSSSNYQSELTSYQYSYPFRVCAFSPSLISDNRIAEYKMTGSNNIKTYLFYGQPVDKVLTGYEKSSSHSNSIQKAENPIPEVLSPGFLFLIVADGRTTSVEDINSSFYIVYDSKDVNHNYEIKLDRSFSTNDHVDTSFLSNHHDYLLYYDSISQVFTYDSNWAKEASFRYGRDDFFEEHKWIWGVVPIFLITAALLVICGACCCRRVSFCRCCRPKYQSDTTDSLSHWTPGHASEQYIYSPDIYRNDQYNSNDYNLGTGKTVDINKLKSDDNEYEYEYEYEYDDPESPYYHNEGDHNSRRKIKIKKLKSVYQNSYANYNSKSPYPNPDSNTGFYMNQYTPSDQRNPNPYEQTANNAAEFNNENGEVPNPYSLPCPMNNTDNSPYYF